MDMKHKLAVITGANSGIGKATALDLAGRGAFIVMVCRNEERALKAQREIIEKTGNTGVEIVLSDMGLQFDVRKAAETISGRFDKVDVLINNAGLFPSKRQETPEGIERTFAVNHLGYFLLTNLLMDKLEASEKGRVINVASDAHKASAPYFDLDNLMLKEGYNPMKAYALSKLCNIMFTRELAKRTATSSVTSYALHPGMVNTRLASEASWLLKFLYFIGRPFMRSPAKGAETVIWLATAEEDEIGAESGTYFKNKKPAKPASVARDDELCKQLWEISEQFCDLSTRVK